MLRDSSPSFGPTHFSSGHAPPSPPMSVNNDALDDIYGSDTSSPILSAQPNPQNLQTHEILSDLPSRQRVLDTDAYREGLSNSKGQHVQAGFDEGYSLAANIGMRAGYILAVLQGVGSALKNEDEALCKKFQEALNQAQKELALHELFSKEWIDEEGIWKWEVAGKEEDVSFREVAEQHPVVEKWTRIVGDLTGLRLELGRHSDAQEHAMSQR